MLFSGFVEALNIFSRRAKQKKKISRMKMER
jgi:hypothetical protein